MWGQASGKLEKSLALCAGLGCFLQLCCNRAAGKGLQNSEQQKEREKETLSCLPVHSSWLKPSCGMAAAVLEA